MLPDTTVPTFPSHVARAVVRKVNSHVNAMIGDSKVIEGEWDEKDSTFGLFQKNELKLGKLLGTGGFSDVYEVLNFTPKENISKFADHQLAARRFYEENAASKNGKSKYVVKHLKTKTMQDAAKFCMAAADLVVEAQFLSSLDHKNILKIRGWSASGIDSYGQGEHDGYFLLLDRLKETLGDRIETWKSDKLSQSLDYSLKRLGLDNDNSAQLLSRTKIAHQIASAVEYLHSKNIVFRDLKPNNVGFDEHGTVKLFDFGLARELPKECTNVNDIYQMSGKIGTVRYMAPEVALSREYNQKVDTYSWSVLYWQCLTLQKPYAEMSRSTHHQSVCRFGERPALSEDMPGSIQSLLKKSWAQSMDTRLTLTEVCAYLERIEKELESNLDITRSKSLVSRPSFRRTTSNTLISMAA
jgi:serine/threonine protein kinase